MTAPHVEVYSEPAEIWQPIGETGAYGWACFTCSRERSGYVSLVAAEADADEHECDPASAA